MTSGIEWFRYVIRLQENLRKCCLTHFDCFGCKSQLSIRGRFLRFNPRFVGAGRSSAAVRAWMLFRRISQLSTAT